MKLKGIWIHLKRVKRNDNKKSKKYIASQLNRGKISRGKIKRLHRLKPHADTAWEEHTMGRKGTRNARGRRENGKYGRDNSRMLTADAIHSVMYPFGIYST